MNNIALPPEIIEELKKRGFNAKLDGALIVFEVNPDLGHCRTYTIERDRAAGNWQVCLSELTYDSDGEDDEEQTVIGNFSTAAEIADSIEEHEGEQ